VIILNYKEHIIIRDGGGSVGGGKSSGGFGSSRGCGDVGDLAVVVVSIVTLIMAL
jgi:hypothetical protein